MLQFYVVPIYSHRELSHVLKLSSMISVSVSKMKIISKLIVVGIWCDTANERRARESKTGSKFILKGARFPIPENHKEHLIFLGLGRVLIDRASLFCEQPVESGVAVQLYRPVIDSPPFSDNFIYSLSNYGYLQNHG